MDFLFYFIIKHFPEHYNDKTKMIEEIVMVLASQCPMYHRFNFSFNVVLSNSTCVMFC